MLNCKKRALEKEFSELNEDEVKEIEENYNTFFYN
ncbi:hypothetical protein FPSM_01370 [Flavobacterium psychrophilum]|nr:hypothetical protein FPSM_01370 [Flavobacterium psychrophilum]